MRKPLPAREVEIGRRLRQFRERVKIPRTVFALEIGISSERLASYEAGRARLPYGVYCTIAQRFEVNAGWLATGRGNPESDVAVYIPMPASNPHGPFSAAFDAFLNDPLRQDVHAFAEHVLDFMFAIFTLGDHLSKRREAQEKLVADTFTLGNIDSALAKVVAVIEGLQREKQNCESFPPQSKAVDEAYQLVADLVKKKALTLGRDCCDIQNVKSPLDKLLTRVKRLTAAHGAKAALAVFLDVNRARVTGWLNGTNVPSGDFALRLRDWADAEEAKQQKSGVDATNTDAGRRSNSPDTYVKKKTEPRKEE